MYKIKTLNKISQIGLDCLDKSRYICGDNIEQPDAVIVRSADMHEMELLPELKCIARAGAGVNNIPVEKCSKAGIVVFNTPGANANAVKELVICALIMSSRRINEGVEWAKSLSGKGEEVQTLVEKGKSAFVGPEIYGKKLGVIGLGAIGVLVANAANNLGMEVYGYDPYISVEAAWGLSQNIHRASDIKTILEKCDYITLHVPFNTETNRMLNAESFAIMKRGVRIINLARRELVDDNAIKEAISAGIVARYVTDFPDDENVKNENIIAIPHLGASTPESEENCAVMAVKQTMDFLENGNIKNSVNYPEITAPMESCTRIIVMHLNIPKMVVGISGILSEKNLNIENMVNKSKKDYACTLLDLNAEVSDDIIESISRIDGVLKVRVIKR